MVFQYSFDSQELRKVVDLGVIFDSEFTLIIPLILIQQVKVFIFYFSKIQT